MSRNKGRQKMDFEEMERIVDDAREIEFYHQQHEMQAWEKEQCARAPVIFALLQEHLPAEVLHDVKEFLSTRYGCDCLHEIVTAGEPLTEAAATDSGATGSCCAPW